MHGLSWFLKHALPQPCQLHCWLLVPIEIRRKSPKPPSIKVAAVSGLLSHPQFRTTLGSIYLPGICKSPYDHRFPICRHTSTSRSLWFPGCHDGLSMLSLLLDLISIGYWSTQFSLSTINIAAVKVSVADNVLISLKLMSESKMSKSLMTQLVRFSSTIFPSSFELKKIQLSTPFNDLCPVPILPYHNRSTSIRNHPRILLYASALSRIQYCPISPHSRFLLSPPRMPLRPLFYTHAAFRSFFTRDIVASS